MNSKDEFDKDKYEQSYSTLKEELTVLKNNINYQTWYDDAKKNADINDFRTKKY